MIKLLILFLFCSLVLIAVLAYRGRYNYGAKLIVLCIMVLSFCRGGWFAAKTSMKLSPFFVFGINRTLQEDIEVVRIHQRTMYFSNGESVYPPKNFLISLYSIISFLFAAGLIMFATRYVALFLTNKISQQLYDCLLSKWPCEEKE